jgi:hypothetical protein
MAEIVATGAELDGHAGEVVEIRGRYEIWDTGPHKVMYETPDGRTLSTRKLVNLALTDGTHVRLWVRPEAEMARLDGRMVVAIGKLSIPPNDSPPSDMAAPTDLPSLLDIQRVDAL